jgi:ferrous iron transport protein A
MRDKDVESRGESVFELVPLSFLRRGQSGRISAVLGGGELMHRLREMGMRAGAEVQMVRTGSPCIIRLGGQKLCFRGDEVASVLVRTSAGAAAPC